MPRGRTEKIDQVKKRLLTRLHSGMFRAGDRFLSNRDIAEQFGISYQTAHVLVGELCSEGLLVRRPKSGTYVAGETTQWVGVQLLFAARAKRPKSFGAKMLERLTRRVAAAGLDCEIALGDRVGHLAVDRIPIVWECSKVFAACCRRRQPTVLINDRPPPGMRSLSVDSVSVDDYSGGSAAAELLLQRTGGDRFAVVVGPAHDRRSQQRTAGFLAVCKSRLIVADGWEASRGVKIAKRVLRGKFEGIFCVNDSLARGVLQWADENNITCPPIVGFDDAPIAETLNLTTLAIPWDELVSAAVALARARLGGSRSASIQQVLTPRPVIRGYGMASTTKH